MTKLRELRGTPGGFAGQSPQLPNCFVPDLAACAQAYVHGAFRAFLARATEGEIGIASHILVAADLLIINMVLPVTPHNEVFDLTFNTGRVLVWGTIVGAIPWELLRLVNC